MRLSKTAVLVSLCLLVPLPAGADNLVRRAVPTVESPGLFALHAASVADPDEPVEIRFEYRDGDHVLAVDALRVDLAGRDSALVALPADNLRIWRTATLAAPELWIYAGDRLLDVLDPGLLAAQARQLRFTHADEIAALNRPGDSLAVAAPGGLDSIACASPCGGGCTPSGDYDCDGVSNSVDNCTDHYNPGQENCDGDPWGDVCDAVDATYQPLDPVRTCMTDKDDHVVYDTWEHNVEQPLRDVSSCGKPNIWNRWIRSRGYCTYTWKGDKACCDIAIGTSIEQISDSADEWCGSVLRDTDFCH